jgi:hypothetical protein
MFSYGLKALLIKIIYIFQFFHLISYFVHIIGIGSQCLSKAANVSPVLRVYQILLLRLYQRKIKSWYEKFEEIWAILHKVNYLIIREALGGYTSK